MLNSTSRMNYATGQKSLDNAIDAMVYMGFRRNPYSYNSWAKYPIQAWIVSQTCVPIIFNFLDFEFFLTSRSSVISREKFWPRIYLPYKTDIEREETWGEREKIALRFFGSLSHPSSQKYSSKRRKRLRRRVSKWAKGPQGIVPKSPLSKCLLCRDERSATKNFHVH
jgi:hypothetical protein